MATEFNKEDASWYVVVAPNYTLCQNAFDRLDISPEARAKFREEGVGATWYYPVGAKVQLTTDDVKSMGSEIRLIASVQELNQCSEPILAGSGDYVKKLRTEVLSHNSKRDDMERARKILTDLEWANNIVKQNAALAETLVQPVDLPKKLEVPEVPEAPKVSQTPVANVTGKVEVKK